MAGEMTRPNLRQSLVDAAFLLVLVLLARIPSFWTAVIDPDEHIFALAAGAVLNGNLPYIGFFDIKPVGSTLMVAAAFAALGKSLVSLRLLGVACVWATALLLRRLAVEAGWSRWLSLAAGVLYVAFSTGLHGLATMTEIMLAPFTVGGMILMHRLWRTEALGKGLLLAAGAGILCGVAVLIKLVPIVPAAFVLGAILLSLLIQRPARLLKLVAWGLAFSIFALVPMVLTGLVYWQAGQWSEFHYANIGFTQVYVGDDLTANNAIRDLIRVFAEIWPLLLLAGLAALGALLGDVRARRWPPVVVSLALVWTLGELVAASVTGHFYGHYFLMMLPPLCLLAVEGARVVHGWLGAATDRPATALAAAAALMALMPMWARTAPEMVGARDLYQRAADEVRSRSGGRAPSLFVTNQELSVLYLLTGADPPSRFAQPVQLLGSQTALLPTDPKAEVARILAERPEFIVVNRDVPFTPWVGAQVEPVLAADYQEVAHLPDFLVFDVGLTRRNDLRIYQRRAN